MAPLHRNHVAPPGSNAGDADMVETDAARGYVAAKPWCRAERFSAGCAEDLARQVQARLIRHVEALIL